MERTPAYLRGRSDFEADVEHILNPYPPMSCEWHEWDSGWFDGANADDGGFDPADEAC